MAALRKSRAVNRLISSSGLRSASAPRAMSVAVRSMPSRLKPGLSTPCLVQSLRNMSTTPSGAIMQRPPRSRPFDVLMSSVTIFAGIATGAWIARETAAKLEDLDVFVPDDDDDDD